MCSACTHRVAADTHSALGRLVSHQFRCGSRTHHSAPALPVPGWGERSTASRHGGNKSRMNASVCDLVGRTSKPAPRTSHFDGRTAPTLAMKYSGPNPLLVLPLALPREGRPGASLNSWPPRRLELLPPPTCPRRRAHHPQRVSGCPYGRVSTLPKDCVASLPRNRTRLAA